jgi:hypothetical protein
MNTLQEICQVALNGSEIRTLTMDELYQAIEGKISYAGSPIDYMDLHRIMKQAFHGRELVECGQVSV